MSFARVLRQTVQSCRVAYYSVISDNRPALSRPRVVQPAFYTGRGKILIGNCQLGVIPSPEAWNGYLHIEAREPSASVQVEDGVVINNSVAIIAERTTIRIGSKSLIGPHVRIFDSDFHGLQADQRHLNNHICEPVYIESNVFIGASATILKGVRIGANSIVAAGALVTKDVPANCIVAGVPAKVVGSTD